jgi:hypothetical protein
MGRSSQHIGVLERDEDDVCNFDQGEGTAIGCLVQGLSDGEGPNASPGLAKRNAIAIK